MISLIVQNKERSAWLSKWLRTQATNAQEIDAFARQFVTAVHKITTAMVSRRFSREDTVRKKLDTDESIWMTVKRNTDHRDRRNKKELRYMIRMLK